MKKKVGLICITAVMILFAGTAAAGCKESRPQPDKENIEEAVIDTNTEDSDRYIDAEDDRAVLLQGEALQDTACQEKDKEKAENEDEVNTEETEEAEEAKAEETEKPDNCGLFFSMAEKQGMDKEEAAAFLQTLMEDNVFCDDTMKITGLIIDDMDGNNQKDMLVMMLDAKETPFYGSGCLWFYMNDDIPYCFKEEECSYYGWFDVFWADIDNDENVEIVFSAQGTGCGAVGDSYKAVFKYKNHEFERMELPSDFESDYDCGINVEVIVEAKKNSYSAYCPYLDETIPFQAENAYDEIYSRQPGVAGGNVRGYFDLSCVEYKGKNALQASEYLNGEGGIVHNVGLAEFIIVWDENGEPRIDKFWVDSW